MNRLVALLAIGGAVMSSVLGCARGAEGVKQEKSALRFTMKSLEGKDVDLAAYEGKVVVVVNVASKCGFTPQYEQLQELHERYHSRGLAILGFPCNQFFGQEPGSAEEIRAFCRLNYGVTFDMFSKVDVNGEDACDLYRLLTSLDTKPKGAGAVAWNFEKYIIDRTGFVVARFGSTTRPDSPDIVSVIERELANEVPSEDADKPDAPSQTLNLADYRWKNRLLLLFSPTRDNETYTAFRTTWDARVHEVTDRDLRLVEAFEDGESREGDVLLGAREAAELRKTFRIDPGSTTFVLIGKDGTEKRRTSAIELDDLFRQIDAMPMRKQEMATKR